jgi:hypothetical protein
MCNDILRKKATKQAEQQQISQEHRKNFEIRNAIKEKKSPTKEWSYICPNSRKKA